MSQQVDERVVEMRFDNQQFESGVKQSLGTLDKLKQALNFSGATKEFKELDNIAKNIDLSGMDKVATLLEKRFSFAGNTIKNIYDDIYDTIKGTVKKSYDFVFGAIKTGGLNRAMNVENARFQLQSLLKDEEKVTGIMAKAKDSVDGTAYAFDVAAKAASMFAASGIEDLDQMHNALTAMADTTAAVNGSYEQMSSIFTKIAGKGRLMGQEIQQLAVAGLNAPALIAKYMREVQGLANATEAEVREMVSAGMISFEMFTDAMEYNYKGAAKRANETFTGALANVKSALARIGEGFYAPFIAQNSALVDVLNSVRKKINEFKSVLVFDEAIGNVRALSKVVTDFGLGVLSRLSETIDDMNVKTLARVVENVVLSIGNVLKGIGSIILPLTKAIRNMYDALGGIIEIRTLTRRFRDFTQNLTLSEQAMSRLYNIATNLGYALNSLFSMLNTVVRAFFTEIGGPLNDLGGTLLGIVEVLASYVSRMLVSIEQSETFQQILKNFGTVLGAVLNVLTKFIDSIARVVYVSGKLGIFERIGDALLRIYEALGKIIAPITGKVTSSFKEMNLSIGDVITIGLVKILNLLAIALEGVAEVVSKIDFTKFVNGLKAVAKGSLGIIYLLSNTVLSMFTGKNNGIQALFGDAFTVGSNQVLKDSQSLVLAGNNIEIFRKAIETIVGWFKGNVSFGQILALFGSGAMIVGLAKLGKEIKKFAKSFQSPVASINGVLGELKKTLVAYQKQIKAENLLAIAKAIGVFTGSILVLTMLAADPHTHDALSEVILYLTMLAAGIGFFIHEISKVSGQTKTVVGNIKSIKDGIFQFFSGLKQGFIEAAKIRSFGKVFKDVAESILMVIGSMIAISIAYNKDPKGIQGAAVSILVIMGLISFIIGVMSKELTFFNKGAKQYTDSIKGIAGVIASLSALLLIMTAFFKTELPTDYRRKIIIIAGSIAGLTFLMKVIGTMNLSSRRIKRSIATELLTTVLSLRLLVSAIKSVFALEIPSDITEKSMVIMQMVGALITMLIAVGLVSKLAQGHGLKGAGATLAGLSLFLITLVGSLMILAIFPEDAIMKGAKGLGLCLAAVGLALAGAGQIVEPETYKSVMAMSGMLAAIVAALTLLTLIPAEPLIFATGTMTFVLMALAVNFYEVSKITNKNVTGTILAMIGETITIAAALAVLSNFDFASILSSSVALWLVMQTFTTGLQTLSGKSGFNPKKALNIFLTGLAMMVPIAAAMAVLSHMPWQGMLSTGFALSAAMAIYTQCLTEISKNKELSGGIKWRNALNALMEGAAMLLPIGIALAVLSKYDWQGMVPVAAAITIAMIGLAGAFKIVSTINPATSVQSAGSLALASVALIPVAIALYSLSGFNWKEMLAAAGSIAITLVALVGALAVTTLIGSLAAPALAGIAILYLFVFSLIDLLELISVIYNDQYSKSLISGGGDILALLGESIGKFVGGIVSGGLLTVGDSLVTFGQNLSDFMTNAQTFLDGASSIDPKIIQGMTDLAAAVVIITGADFVNGIKTFISGALGPLGGGKKSSLESFGEELKKFGPLIASFGESVKGVKPEAVQASASAVKMMAEAAATLPKNAGLFDKIFGEQKNLSDFGKELESFGTSIVAYGNTVADLKTEAVTASYNAAKMMLEIADGLPEPDNLTAKIFGDHSLASFAWQLVYFGQAIVKYADIVKDLDTAGIEASATAAQHMSDLANTLPTNETLLQTLFGGDQTTLSEFGEELVAFGKAIARYSKAISGKIDTAAMQAALTAATHLMQLEKALTPENGSKMIIFNMFKSEKGDLGKFGTRLEKFGNAISKYSTSIKGVNTTNMTAVNTEISNIVTLIKDLNDNKSNFGVLKEFTDALSIVGTDSVTAFTNAFNNSHELVKTAITQFFLAMTLKVGSYDQTLKDLGSATITNYLNGITNGVASSTTIGDVTTKLVNQLKFKIADFYGPGYLSSDNYLSGFSTKAEESNTISDFVTSVIVQMSKLYKGENSPIYTVGKYTAQGFKDGIIDNAKMAQEAADSLGEEFLNAIRDKLGIHSPSEEGWNIGKFFDLGILEGLKDWWGNVQTWADKAVDSFMVAFNGLDVTKIFDIGEDFGGLFGEGSMDGFLESFDTDSIAKVLDEMSGKIVESVEETGAYDMSDITEGMQAAAESVTSSSNTITKEQKRAVKVQDRFWETMLEIQKNGENASKYSSMTWEQYEEEVLGNVNSLIEQYASAVKDSTKSVYDSIGVFESVKEVVDDGSDAIMKQLDLFSEVSTKEKQLAEKASSIAGQMGIFDEVAESEEVEAQSITKNIDDQVSKYKDFLDIMRSLKDKIKDENVLKEISNMGIGQIEQLRALNKLSASELDRFVAQYQEKMSLSVEIANEQIGDELTKEDLMRNLSDQVDLYKEFGILLHNVKGRVDEQGLINILNDMSISSIDELRAMNAMTDEELSKYVETFRQKFQEAANIAKEQQAGAVDNSLTVQQIKDDLHEQNALYAEYNTLFGEQLARSEDARWKEMIQGLGINDIAYLRVLAKATDEQMNDIIKELNLKWGQSYSIALKKNEELAKSIESQISDLFSVNIDLEKFMQEYDGTIDSIMRYLGDVMGSASAKEMKQVGMKVLNFVMYGAEESVNGIDLQTLYQDAVATTDETNNVANEAGQELGNEVTSGIVSKNANFYKAGTENVNKYIQAITDLKKKVYSTGKMISQKAVAGLSSIPNQFYSAGANAAAGFIYGFESMELRATAAGRRIAMAAYRAAMAALDEHSPSKVMMHVGEFAGQGFIMGLDAYDNAAARSGGNLAQSAIEAISDTVAVITDLIAEGFEFEPVITPVLNLENMQASASDITRMMNGAIGSINVGSVAGAFGYRGQNGYEEEEGPYNRKSTNITFNQNNYSPKALRPIEIYRQTRNQLSQMKGVTT